MKETFLTQISQILGVKRISVTHLSQAEECVGGGGGGGGGRSKGTVLAGAEG